MFALAAGKARTGAALDNPVLRTEGRVTIIDGLLAVAVLAGLLLNAALGWWWVVLTERRRKFSQFSGYL
jgi:divalent metal cation (Fe/Co/Zn/Cd) transporter